MKVINSLIAVEVPRGAEVKISGTNWVCHETDKYPGVWNAIVQLPFPAEIIGLASEIDQLHEIDILLAADYDLSVSLFELLHGNQLTTTPTTDIIFLRKKL